MPSTHETGHGNNIDKFCLGFDAVAGGYAIGILANWWNPIGWVGTSAGIILGAGCAAYAMR